MPGSVFSGRRRLSKGARGVFFCYSLPALDKQYGEFTLEAGPTRWYLYDLDRDDIIETPGRIIDSIRSRAPHPTPMHHRREDTQAHPPKGATPHP